MEKILPFFIKSLKTLEFDKVLAQIEDMALCLAAKEKIRDMLPETSLPAAKILLEQTASAAGLMERRGSPPVSAVLSPEESVKKSFLGGLLSIREILEAGRFENGPAAF
jgi:DNA mismatch repair protein MutS2